MLDPLTNQVANAGGRRLDAARRLERVRAAASGKKGRADEPDSFDGALRDAERLNASRPLADADQEDAKEDRDHSRGAYAPNQPPAPSPGGIDLSA